MTQLSYLNHKKKNKLSDRLYRVEPALAFLVLNIHTLFTLFDFFLLKVFNQIFVAFLSQEKVVLFNSFHPIDWSYPRISSLSSHKVIYFFSCFLFLFFVLAGSTTDVQPMCILH